jgi:cell division protein FtsI (penicillin-binding protein 3)
VAPQRPSGPVPRVAPDRPAGHRAQEDRGVGPGQRLPRNARTPRGEGAARPDPVPGSPRGARRPPLRGAAGGGPRRPARPSRWLTIQRGQPGRRVGITLLTIAIVLTLFAGRLVQLQGTESTYYKTAAAAEQVQVNPLPALRGTIYGSNG